MHVSFKWCILLLESTYLTLSVTSDAPHSAKRKSGLVGEDLFNSVVDSLDPLANEIDVSPGRDWGFCDGDTFADNQRNPRPWTCPNSEYM